MSCACVLKLADLLKGLVPGIEIPVPEVPALEPLSSIAAPLSAARNITSAQLATIANLPALPPPPEAPQLASMQAAMQAAGEMTAMGVSPVSPLAAPRLASTIGALNANFAAVPLPAPPSASLLKLSMVCARISAVRSMLGIDPLSPAALPQLKASLAAVTSPAVPPPQLSTVAAYASLAGNSASLGGVAAMLPVLTAMASLTIPPVTVPIASLTNLLATLMAIGNVQSVLGINPCMPGAVPAIQARLAPLAQLEGLEIPAPAMTAASAAAPLVPVRPMLGAGLARLPGMNLGPLAKLAFPNVAPLTLAMATANTAGVVTSSSCSSSCPMGGKF